MKVVMPIALRYPDALRAFIDSAHYADIDPEIVSVRFDPLGYWRLVRELGLAGGFILVEHDIVVRPETIGELLACPEPWCGFPYLEAPGDPVTGLGCVKLAPEVTRRIAWGTLGTPVWQNVDYTLIGVVRDELGYTEHRHEPPLEHLNPRVWPDLYPKVQTPLLDQLRDRWVPSRGIVHEWTEDAL